MLVLHAQADQAGVYWSQLGGCMGGALGGYMPEGQVHGQAGWEGQH